MTLVLAHWKPASFRQVQSKMAMNVHWYVLSYSCEYACISAWTLLFILTWKVLAGTSMRRISRVRYHAFYMYRGCLVPPSRNALPAVRNPKYALQLHRVCRFPSDSFPALLVCVRLRAPTLQAPTVPAKPLHRCCQLHLLWLVELAVPNPHRFHHPLLVPQRHRHRACPIPAHAQSRDDRQYHHQSRHPRHIQVLRFLCPFLCRTLWLPSR